jgi:hypothetical protein
VIGAGIGAAQLGNHVATRALGNVASLGRLAQADGVTTSVIPAPGQPGYVGAPPRGTSHPHDDGAGVGSTGRARGRAPNRK